ncbi:MAG: hypothetical protein JXA37_02000 [Chloroflexia bacterium]|nr:hypothetical protein [Chloroflexia bacterium]
MSPILEPTVFVTMVRTESERAQVRLLIDSIRAFGGPLAGSPIWVFAAGPQELPELAGPDLQILPLEVSDTARRNYFGPKVAACARAEQLAAGKARSLVWISPNCLVLQPPLLFELGENLDAALRPVHVQNVGLRAEEPLNDYWRRVYQQVGVEDLQMTVESFVGGRRLRAYFNTHAFSINPARGLLQEWLEHLEALVGDESFHAGLDDAGHIFLFQALLSTLLASRIEPQRLRLLPPDYGYPYNLQASVPPERRAQRLNDLACLTYEGRSLDIETMDDIAVEEPLASWLAEHY